MDFGSGGPAWDHRRRNLGHHLLTLCSRLFMPVEENHNQHIYVIDKKEDGSVEKKKLYGVRYVPLTDAPEE